MTHDLITRTTIGTGIIGTATMTGTIQGIVGITEMIAGGMTAEGFGIGVLWTSSFVFKDLTQLRDSKVTL